MGVTGLLGLLKSIQRPTELKKLTGETLGVDAYGWLHRGAIACATQLAQGKPSRKYVDYCMHRVRMLQHFGHTPYLVFDGDFLPSKASTEAARESKREESRKRGVEFLKAGKSALADQEFQKAIDITPEMARHVIEALKKANVSYVVAPYEADAQLVYLERKGIITGIISDDSDLLVFGAKRLFTKLDAYGSCIEINRRDFCACREVSLTGWTDTDFRRMAIFSGCDYLDSISGIGLKTAYRLMRKYKTPERVVQMLRFEGKSRVSENYLPMFVQAELTFLHQRVFCPERRELVLLTDDPAADVEHMSFIGAYVEPELARAIAAGDVNPITKEPIVVREISPRKRRAQTTPTRSTSKPINSYFSKPHGRIVLGEMDRNCFAVDPQQVAAVTQNGLVPRVFPLPRPYLEAGAITRPSNSTRRPVSSVQVPISPRLSRRRTEPLSGILDRVGHGRSSLPGLRTASLTARDARAPKADPAMPISRPAKKARLCEDARSDDDACQGIRRSKFFPTGESKSAVTAETKPPDTYLLSDDSIDEALLALPDMDVWHSSCKGVPSIDIFNDESLGACNGSEPKNRTHPPSEPSRDSASESAVMLPPLKPRKTETSPPAARVSLAQFYCQLDDNRSGPVMGDVPTPASTTTTASRRSPEVSTLFTPTTGLDAPSATPLTIPTPLPTPLQRIAARAFRRGSVPNSPSLMKPTSSTRDKPPACSSIPVNPSFVPLPKVDLAEVEALHKACGSEDQMLPSDDENAIEEELQENRGVRLDLSRFLNV